MRICLAAPCGPDKTTPSSRMNTVDAIDFLKNPIKKYTNYLVCIGHTSSFQQAVDCAIRVLLYAYQLSHFLSSSIESEKLRDAVQSLTRIECITRVSTTSFSIEGTTTEKSIQRLQTTLAKNSLPLIIPLETLVGQNKVGMETLEVISAFKELCIIGPEKEWVLLSVSWFQEVVAAPFTKHVHPFRNGVSLEELFKYFEEKCAFNEKSWSIFNEIAIPLLERQYVIVVRDPSFIYIPYLATDVRTDECGMTSWADGQRTGWKDLFGTGALVPPKSMYELKLVYRVMSMFCTDLTPRVFATIVTSLIKTVRGFKNSVSLWSLWADVAIRFERPEAGVYE